MRDSFPCKCSLIVAFLTFYSSDHFYSYTVNLFVPDVFMELFINTVEFIIGKLNFSIAVTIDNTNPCSNQQIGALRPYR